MEFKDRTEAGKLLANALKAYQNAEDTIILALPRGGLPVGVEIKKSLGIPMDICLVRKLGTPGHEELAMGAIAMGNVTVMNEDVVSMLGISEEAIMKEIKKESLELERRNKLYRSGKPAPMIKGKRVILVDDGLATGATMKGAVKAVKAMGAKEIIVAVPVSATDTFEEMQALVDKVVCLYATQLFYSVGQWYEEFPQVSDEEVKVILNQ